MTCDAPPASQRAEREVARHGQQALFAPQEAEALPDVPQQPPGGGLPLRRRGPLRLDVLLLRSDLRLRDGGGEEAHSVDAQQRRDAHLVVEIGGNRDHHRCQRLQHAGDGVGLGVVSLRNEHGVKALVGHHVHAVDGTDDEAPHRQHREAEPPLTEDQRRRGVDARGDKVQRVDGALPGKAVKDGAGKDRRDDLWRRERGDVDGVQQRRVGIVQHQQAQGEAGHGVAQHGDDAAQRDDGKVPRPQRSDSGLQFVLFCHRYAQPCCGRRASLLSHHEIVSCE